VGADALDEARIARDRVHQLLEDHDLAEGHRLLRQVPAERFRPDPRRPQELRREYGSARHHERAGLDADRVPGHEVDDLGPLDRGPVRAGVQPLAEVLRRELEPVGVLAVRERPQHRVRAAPRDQRGVVAPALHGLGQALHRVRVGQLRELRRERLAHELVTDGPVERVVARVEEPLALRVELVPLLVVVEGGALDVRVVARRRARPVRGHAADRVRRGRRREVEVGVLVRVLVVVGEARVLFEVDLERRRVEGQVLLVVRRGRQDRQVAPNDRREEVEVLLIEDRVLQVLTGPRRQARARLHHVDAETGLDETARERASDGT
jgi:hypothetical protein